MIPASGPAATGSAGERLLYHLLKDQLSDEFVVIHSLPWLSSAACQLAGVARSAVTGELDFLVIHSELGVLALEVKGGIHQIQGLAFVHVDSATASRAVEQVRRNTHGLAKWLGIDPALRLRIGYGLVFPHSDFQGQTISTALTDRTVDPPETIVVDKPQLVQIGSRIRAIMFYWRQALNTPILGESRMNSLIDTLCPTYDGTPSWASRAVWDDKFWLRLTPEQSSVVDDVVAGQHRVVNGWPGTGKTLVLIESARRLLNMGRSVLVLTFNALLADYIRRQIVPRAQLRASTWHAFCRAAVNRTHGNRELDRDWLDSGCVADLTLAAEAGLLDMADVLLIDEAQSFRKEWIEWLSRWQGNRHMAAFCDETQIFAFEEDRSSLATLCSALNTPLPFALTIALRSPHAVYQRLKAVVPPSHQLHIPRELEADTLEEHLASDIPDALEKILARLAADGMAQQDIVVLSKYGWVHADEHTHLARYETLSRFRGLESPIVIVCDAQTMDDYELFCAYSRATTLCIALYNAEILGIRGPQCQFQATLFNTPDNVRKAELARQNAFPGEIIRTRLKPQWLQLKTVMLGWLPEWRAWVLELEDELSDFWIDYLVSHHSAAVYSWRHNSLRVVYKGTPITDVMNEGAGEVPFDLQHCTVCAIVTPQQRNPRYADPPFECGICRAPSEDVHLDDTVVDELSCLDRLLQQPPKTLSVSDRQGLPFSLAAGAALRYAVHAARGEPLCVEQISSGRGTYRASLAFLYSLINLLPPNKIIHVPEVATELYQRYCMPGNLSIERWKQDFALAAAVALKRGHLVKVSKGRYRVAQMSSDSSVGAPTLDAP